MKAVLFAVLAGVFWGVGEIFTRSVLHARQIGPITAIALRSTVALPFLWLAFWIAIDRSPAEVRGWWREADSAAIWKVVLGSGICAGAAGMICFYVALSLGEISKVKPIAFAVAPAIAVLLGWLVLGEAMTARKAAGVLMILAGVVLLTGR
jgi:transporter family protein